MTKATTETSAGGTAADVTAQPREPEPSTRRGRGSEGKCRILETTLRTIPDGVQVLDADLRLVAWNDQLFDILDLDKDAILAADDPGRALRQAMALRGDFGDGDTDEIVARREAVARSPDPIRYEKQLSCGKWVECRGAPIEGGGHMTVYRDVTEHRALVEKLERQAATDELTGALNRRRFLDVAEREYKRAQRFGRSLSFVALEFDAMQAVNDRHGHDAGDIALRQLVATCRAGLRETDRIGRLAGRGFTLILPETNGDGAKVVAERLRQTVEELTISAEGAEFGMTISAGTAQLGFGHHSARDVIATADAALSEARHAGRNCVVCAEGAPEPDLAAGLAGE